MSLQYGTKLTMKRQSYTVSDKLRIIQFAEKNGNHAAEREFGVSESNVCCEIFFFKKNGPKIGCVLYMGAHYIILYMYTQVNTVINDICEYNFLFNIECKLY